jgi:non-ribosomal peptide synthetase component F
MQPLVHEAFESWACRLPHQPAVIHGSLQLTYGQLNDATDAVAAALRRLGVRPGVMVVLLLERSVEFIVSQLAVLKAGGAFVPLDPHVPPARREWMLEDCQPHVILTHSGVVRQGLVELQELVEAGHERSWVHCWGPGGINNAMVLLVDDLLSDGSAPAAGGGADGDAPESWVSAGPGHVAYCIFTSGTTGGV